MSLAANENTSDWSPRYRHEIPMNNIRNQADADKNRGCKGIDHKVFSGIPTLRHVTDGSVFRHLIGKSD